MGGGGGGGGGGGVGGGGGGGGRWARAGDGGRGGRVVYVDFNILLRLFMHFLLLTIIIRAQLLKANNVR